MRVLVAMSGGVDSSVAALLLQREGHDLVGVFMRNGVAGKSAQEKSCCSASDARDAAVVADRLGIPFYAVDYAEEFAALMDHFGAEYRRGRTPNPCVLCNQHLKFGHLFRLADDVGAAAVATGHYARVVDGAMHLARDRQKDQTYYLFGIERQALARTLFPLGDLDKAAVRALANEAGLVTADKPESMEICFVTSGDYRDVVRARGGGGVAGRFVDAGGRELGRHDGIDGFTVGQRKGLPALGLPHYVAAIDAASGDVTLVPRDGIARTVMFVDGLRWLVEAPAAGAPLLATVKVRARHEGAMASIVRTGDDTARVEFATPVAAITPGQAAVFYAGSQVLGGGWIAGSA
jgi:tRNA-uridine 2-sulfurtransferase